jgi:hypothetical protein
MTTDETCWIKGCNNETDGKICDAHLAKLHRRYPHWFYYDDQRDR